MNLVNNALAYGAAGTPVIVHVEGDERSVTVRVHNEGEPIPEELRPALFDAFKRGKRGVGAGLGLFIVQRIVRTHGGTIDVDSSAYGGTTMSVRLPRA